jgi:cytochrome P450
VNSSLVVESGERRGDRLPPGPKRTPFGLVRFKRDALGWLRDLTDYGDFVQFRIVGRTRHYLLADPEAIHRFLVTHHRSVTKGASMQQARRVLGNGLLTSEADLHQKQRRLLQRGFVHPKVEAYGDRMLEVIEASDASWRAGEVLDVHNEMYRLTLRVIGHTLISTDLGRHAPTLNESLEVTLRWANRLTLPYSSYWERLPLPSLKRLHVHEQAIHETMADLVEERRAFGAEPDDIFSLLLRARENGAEHVTDELIRDEIATILFAGHETTAAQLTWTWYLLARHPEIEGRVLAELDRVVGTGPLRSEHVPQLELVGRVLREALRLYPPVWVFSRTASEDLEHGGYVIPRGSMILMSPWVTHRDPRWWEDADRFDPDRWVDKAQTDRARHAFFPFGAGPRICLGAPFTMLEAALTLAHVSRHWRLLPVDDDEVQPRPWLTLRPGSPVRMRLEPRS